MYGAVVRRARRERGLTQRQLASIAGIEQPNLSAIETGRRLPTAETLHRLLSACGFELIATAGDRVLAFPPPSDDDAGPPDPRDPVVVASSTSADRAEATRARRLVAALDVAEAIMRSR